MKRLAVGLALSFSAAVCSGQDPGQPAAKAPESRIGQIFIVGNTVTREDVILNAVNLLPGQVLRIDDLRAAEKNLGRLGIFASSPEVHPTVAVLDDPTNPDAEYKDVLVTVEETSTGGVRLMAGLSSAGEPVVSVVWEERNFDPLRWPTSIDDLRGGGAFRGAGRMLRLELLQMPVLPGGAPHIFRTGGLLVPFGDFNHPIKGNKSRC
jgi:hypothetical protein